uniref:Protein kinase domain-containing protein n=1 Tax=Moniliophthora roreri TaxID=221103 RepID=A0A0W0GA62_MONRR
MAFLQGSSNAAIAGGQFNNIQGSQYNTNIYPPIHQARESTIWDDYRRVRTSDVYVTRVVGESAVKRDDEKGWRRVIARRTISLARVEGKDKEFLHVAYDGPDAFKAFAMDFKQFSSIKHPNVTQLFGYNDNQCGLPALIFHDELIPLERIIVMAGVVSPVLRAYFEHQFDILQIADDVLNVGELWVDIRTGTLRRGPYIRTSFGQWPFGSAESNSILKDHFCPLSIQTYKDTSTVFNYLTKILSTHAIIQGISASSAGVVEWLYNEDALFSLRFFAGTVYNRHRRKIIAKHVDARARWYYKMTGAINIPDVMVESQTIMEDGSNRFMLTPMDIQNMQDISLQYTLCPGDEYFKSCNSWLTQAHGMCYTFQFVLQRKKPLSRVAYTPLVAAPAYLFIRPIPRPSDDVTAWKSWVEGQFYFWSFDPSGQQKISAVTQALLRLPSFTLGLFIVHRYWDSSHYETVKKLHRHCGFDPRKSDLTHSLGLPILEVIGDDDRFRILEEDSSSSSTSSDISEPCNEPEADDDFMSSESDEEIVLYPRSAAAL